MDGIYDESYYRNYDGGKNPYGRSPVWLGFFGTIADRIVADYRPRSVLDAGCAMGLLVEALRARGVEAWGVDVSQYAISQVPAEIRPYCWTGSVTEELPRCYDLIVSIEVLEHVPREEALTAIRNMAMRTDRVLFSSTPDGFDDPTHCNIQSGHWWRTAFARQGLMRESAAPFVSPQAMVLHRPEWWMG